MDDRPSPCQPWLVAWRVSRPRRWGWRGGGIRQVRVDAPGREEAVARAAVAGGCFLFAVSLAQLEHALAGLVPEKRRSASMVQGYMLGWLPMVAPEFVVVSSRGGATFAHPVRAACSRSALATWAQANYSGRAIACGLRRDWEQALAWLRGMHLDLEAPAWAAPLHGVRA